MYILYHVIFCVVYHVIYHVIYFYMIHLYVWLCIVDYHLSHVLCHYMYYVYVCCFGWRIILIHLSFVLFSSMYVYHPSLGDTIVRLFITSSVCYYVLILRLEISYDTLFIYTILFELFRFIIVLLFWGGVSLSIIMPCILCSHMHVHLPTIMVRCYC